MRNPALISILLLAAGCGTQQAQAPPPKPPPPLLEFVGEWGTRGDGPGKLGLPVAIATDMAGNVYIADSQVGFIHKFTPTGHPLLSFEDRSIKDVRSLAVDRGGAIYAGIMQPSAIIVFYPDGSRLRRIGSLHAPPEAIAVDDEGNIFSLCLSASLEKINPLGRSVKFLHKRGSEVGQFAYPSAIAAHLDGFLYVADMGNGRVQKLTRDGDFVAAWSVADAVQKEIPAIAGLATLKENVFMLLLHQEHYQLQARSMEGNILVQDALAGLVPPNKKDAWEIAASPRGELFLLDNAGARVLRFRINF